MTQASAPQPSGSGESGAALDLELLTEEILPALIARLRASRLGELEIRSQGWRVRLRRDHGTSRRSGRPHDPAAGLASAPLEDAGRVAPSPAVGYFVPARSLLLGQEVQAGDQLGSVDVLGIGHDVTAPISGIVTAVLAEPGQAVEYGQALVEIDSLGEAIAEPDVELGVEAATAAASAPATSPASGAAL